MRQSCLFGPLLTSEQSSFGQWPIVLKAALVNDRVDMSLSISKAAVRPEYGKVLALNDDELAHVMEIIQSVTLVFF